MKPFPPTDSQVVGRPSIGAQSMCDDLTDLEWQAFCYVAGGDVLPCDALALDAPGLDAVDLDAFESRLVDDQAARDAVVRMVELVQSVALLGDQRLLPGQTAGRTIEHTAEHTAQPASPLSPSRFGFRRHSRTVRWCAAAAAVYFAFLLGVRYAGTPDSVDSPGRGVAGRGDAGSEPLLPEFDSDAAADATADATVAGGLLDVWSRSGDVFRSLFNGVEHGSETIVGEVGENDEDADRLDSTRPDLMWLDLELAHRDASEVHDSGSEDDNADVSDYNPPSWLLAAVSTSEASASMDDDANEEMRDALQNGLENH